MLLQRKLRQVGFPDGKLPGVAYDDSGGHGADPWRSVLRRESVKLKVLRHATCAEASLRILQAFAARDANGPYQLGQYIKVDAAALAELMQLATVGAAATAGSEKASPGGVISALIPRELPT